MEIDTRDPEGNTLTALGIATRLMKEAHRDRSEIDALIKSVMEADSAKQAREFITKATFGSITFYDPDDEDDGE